MAHDGTTQNNTERPLPQFYFKVDFGNGMGQAFFQEVSGLHKEAQVIEYRQGNIPAYSNFKIPGLKKFGTVILKKGIMQNDKGLFDWFSLIKINTFKPGTIKISLLDQAGNAAMIWTLQKAFPAKISSTDLKSEIKEIAIETIEIAYQELTVQQG